MLSIRSLPYGCDVSAVPVPVIPAVGKALIEEYRSVARSIAEQRERAERLRALADQATAHADEQEHALRDLAEVLGLDPQLRLEDLDGRLRGAQLQEIAVRVLSERHPAGEPIHYKKWYALLREAGYAVGGRDPLATFLASVSRSAQVRAVGRRSGLYVIVGGASTANAPR